MVIEQQQRFGMSMYELCRIAGLIYPTIMRWRRRTEQGLPPVSKRGPKKAQFPDLCHIRKEVSQLSVRPKRTLGIGEVYARHKSSISRRDLAAVVNEARDEKKAQAKQRQHRLEWHQPGLVWSLDPLELKGFGKKKLPVLQMRDLAARYKFPLMVNLDLCGEEIAGYLVCNFRRFGAPLVLKRDNGPNLNHKAVNDALQENGVVPLNSPPYYPQYNGAIEHDQAELKQTVREVLAGRRDVPKVHAEPYLQAAVFDLNHRPRPVLNGRTACQVFFSEKDKVCFTLRDREEIFLWILNFSRSIIKKTVMLDRSNVDAGWRFAVTCWLRMKGYLTIYRNGEVLPTFFEKISHQ